MRRLKLDRIASSTRNAQLRREVVVGDELIAREGYILAVRVLQNKFAYDTVEDVTGRMIKVKAGDILAGVLGYRRALRGYAGIVPDELAVGDKLHILNLGGVLGICTAGNPELGPPFEVEVLGAVLTFPDMGDRVGEPAHIYTTSILPSDSLNNLPPLIMIAGTSMNSGKTFAATELVRVLSKQGRNVAACKLTGVSLMRVSNVSERTLSGRPFSMPTRSFRAPSKSSSPRMARSVIAEISARLPANSASSSMHSCWMIVESISAMRRRFLRFAAG